MENTYLAELIQNIGDFALIGAIIHENNGTLAHQNHTRQCRPGSNIHGNLRWDVCISGQPGSLERCRIVSHADKVGVADKNGDNIVWMTLDPGSDVREEALGSARVEQITRGMAIGYSIGGSIVVRLPLKHANAIIQLGEDSELLVRCCIVGIDKWRIMSANVSDIGVLPIAEFWIIVAWRCIGRGSWS